MRSEQLPVLSQNGDLVGSLGLSALPDHDDVNSLFWYPESDGKADPDVSAVQLIEGAEYRYEFRIDESVDTPITTSHPEILRRSTVGGRTGRLRLGSFVGTIDVEVFLSGEHVGTVGLEVRSRKLAYESEYRWMLRDLAESAAEVVLAAFSPASWQFDADGRQDARSLYQRFAFLSAMLDSEILLASMSRIVCRPHTTWLSGSDLRPPGVGGPASSKILKNLLTPGPRVTISRPVAGMSSLPLRLKVPLHHATWDNTPNQFVKFALTHWLHMVHRVGDCLEKLPRRPSRRRGLAEVRRTTTKLEAWLSSPVFKRVSDLVRFPQADQVLQKGEGYREVYRMFLLSEAAASLRWPAGSDTVYAAGKRDVATLYEYWAYLQLAAILRETCDEGFHLGAMVQEVHGGLELGLRRGHEHVFAGNVKRLGRQLRVELWFNRTFGSDAVWTRAMRPDCSLRVSDCDSATSGREVWVHFDAKYRVDGMAWARNASPPSDERTGLTIGQGRTDKARLGAKAADLSKMHAYKDAIRLSSGAYVLYPGGDDRDEFRQYQEILPGLGAFPLRPSKEGGSRGGQALKQFLSELLDHLASIASQHERARYWMRRAYRSRPPAAMESPSFPRLRRPAADTRTLLGYVKSERHWHWINRMGLYNLRGDRRTGSVGLTGPEIGAEIVILYGPSMSVPVVHTVEGGPQVLLASTLQAEDYPDPGGSVYLALRLGEQRTLPTLGNLVVDELLQEHGSATLGAPCVVSWLEVMLEMARRSRH